ncbi:MAG: hypothetical protein EOM34_07785 [Clostridia bacterium]|nr:OadG family transporter subunit [Lachnospiraceae bacterium]NCC00571.1 hypothetical protein [Clostridia bacterium]NCD01999.1 hypothetical protein [Clostridia bacterium]
MIKKLWLILCTALIIAGCTACGQAANVQTETTEMESVVTGNLVALAGMDDAAVDMQIAQYESGTIDETTAVLIETLKNWKTVHQEAGDYISCGDVKVTRSGNEITGSVRGDFTKRDVDFSMSFTKDLSELKSMTLNPVYSIGELMKRAGLNTLMGMGTVFTVLIIISLIIYAFGFIGRHEKKKDEIPAPVIVPETTDEDLSDDLELVAVIAAAIAASEDVPVDSLVVRSIRRRTSSNRWKNQ